MPLYNNMRLIGLSFFIAFLLSCSAYDKSRKKIFIKDDDFLEIGRQYSPDGRKMLLTYGIDQGALGHGIVGTAVLTSADTNKNLKPFTISATTYPSSKWINNDTAVFYFDYLKRMRLRQTRIYSDMPTSINGVHLLFTISDPVDSSFTIDTLFQEQSPNKNWTVVVYRYTKDDVKEDFLNISVLHSGITLPEYGNFLISDIRNDYIYNCEWTNDNKLILYTSGSSKNVIENFLVQGKPNVNYEIVADDTKYGTATRWTKKNGM